MSTKKIGYWVNHDDVMFLTEQKRGGEKNWPLAVYMDACREAARLYQLWPKGNEAFTINWHWRRPGFETARIDFDYCPTEVKSEFGATDEQIFDALCDLRNLGVLFSDAFPKSFTSERVIKKTYRIAIGDFKPARRSK